MADAIAAKKAIFIRRLPAYLLYLFVFLLPWQARWIFQEAAINGSPFEYGRMSLYVFDIVLLVLTAVVCWRGRLLKLEPPKSVKIIQLLILIIIIYALAAAGRSNQYSISLYWAVRLLLGLGLFWAVVKINFSKIRLAIITVIAASIQGLLAVWQFLDQSVWSCKWLGMSGQSAKDLGVSVVEFGIERWLRAYGSFPHPNILGGLLALSFLAIIYLTFRIEHKYHKLFLILSSSLISLGVLFSYSRSGWLVFSLMFIIGFIFIQKQGNIFVKKFSRWLWLYILILMAVFAIATLPIIKTRLNLGPTAERLEIKSSQDRLAGWREGFAIFNQHRLFGAGLGQYAFVGSDLIPAVKGWDIEPTHNTYLLALAELGAIGFILLVVLFYYIIYLLRQSKNGLVWLGFVGFNILLFFDHYFWTAAMGIYWFFLFLALLISAFLPAESKGKLAI